MVSRSSARHKQTDGSCRASQTAASSSTQPTARHSSRSCQWTWLSVTGEAELIGPEQKPDGFDDDALRRLLREVFHAAGGTHDDLNEYDRAMAEEGRVVVLVAPERTLGNS